MKKKLILTALVLAASLGVSLSAAPRATAAVDCSLVRCRACPAGQHLKLTPPDCCTCLPN